MTGPLVSVVIPTYNRARTLRRAIDSAAGQDVAGGVEIVVVDNASSDDTEAVIEEARRDVPGLVYRRWDENVGPVENWRRGIELSRGPWTKVLWSDDWLEPSAVRSLLDLTRDGAVTVTCQALVHGPDGERVAYSGRRHSFGAKDVLCGLISPDEVLPFSPAAGLVRRSDALAGLAQALPGPCTRKAIGPDVALFYWGVLTGGRGEHLPVPLAHFDAKHGSISVDEGARMLRACYDSSLMALAGAAGATVPTEVQRRVSHRSAMLRRQGVPEDALHPGGRLSVRELVASGRRKAKGML
ncbi:glycosyltransferase family 2 protein [Motilibacter aurantiacus]|uniref:glycosyltransferase family 2 protein n=1 Tax=Motilibacter aurantiacus TaxID=2714955 RepID=UPI0014073CDE|nr:glycosyltransferase family 2 protein [Motilibacter aurantiacus]NHC46359.1 glycosyltransferase family 2 protein [Motilibacter aurantiacus]